MIFIDLMAPVFRPSANLKLACASLLTLSLISCDLDESPSKESDKGNETITTDNPQLPPPITGTPNDNEEEPKENLRAII